MVRKSSIAFLTSVSCIQASRKTSNQKPTKKVSHSLIVWIIYRHYPITWRFVHAVEKLVDLDVPPRGQAIRVIVLGTATDVEPSRVVGYTGDGHGRDECVPLLLPRARENSQSMLEMLSGQRMMGSYIRPGGVWRDSTS